MVEVHFDDRSDRKITKNVFKNVLLLKKDDRISNEMQQEEQRNAMKQFNLPQIR